MGPGEAHLPSKSSCGRTGLDGGCAYLPLPGPDGQGGCSSFLGLGAGGEVHLPGFTWGGSGHGRRLTVDPPAPLISCCSEGCIRWDVSVFVLGPGGDCGLGLAAGWLSPAGADWAWLLLR